MGMGPFFGDGYFQEVDTHPPDMAPEGTWDLGYHRIQSASRRYTSYWNAFLFYYLSDLELKILKVELPNFWDTGFCLRFTDLFDLRLQFLQVILEALKPAEGD